MLIPKKELVQSTLEQAAFGCFMAGAETAITLEPAIFHAARIYGLIAFQKGFGYHLQGHLVVKGSG